MKRRPRAGILLLGLAVGVLAAPPSAVAAPEAAGAARPQPPSSAELRTATPPAGVGTQESLGAPTPLPGGSRQTFPDHRVVSLYGAPQMGATVLGRLSTSDAGRRVHYEASRYRWPGAKPVVPAFELVASIATADAGRDGRYRFRQSDATIASYLRAARRADTRLLLDVQPGRASLASELYALRRWLREPDIDLAIDPEWNVGPRGVPGRTDGSVDARTINHLSWELGKIANANHLPQKLLVIHQFRRGSVSGRSLIKRRNFVAPTLSFDGIGSASAKRAGYEALSSRRISNGFCVFYRLDRGLMSPGSVVNLSPRPLYVLYQ